MENNIQTYEMTAQIYDFENCGKDYASVKPSRIRVRGATVRNGRKMVRYILSGVDKIVLCAAVNNDKIAAFTRFF